MSMLYFAMQLWMFMEYRRKYPGALAEGFYREVWGFIQMEHKIYKVGYQKLATLKPEKPASWEAKLVSLF